MAEIDDRLQEVNAELINPDLTPYQRRCLLDESMRLNTKRLVERSQEPKLIFPKVNTQ